LERLSHTPVMVEEVVEALVTDPRGLYVDATVGAGGHALSLLSALDESGRLIAIDRDQQAIEASRITLAPFLSRTHLLQDVFWRIASILRERDVGRVHGCLFDLGVSSMQIDAAERGFSYRQDGPLDMRMDQSGGRTAADVVNGFSERDLVRILREYGEERRAPAIARRICSERRRGRIERTLQLRGIIASTVFGRHVEKTMARTFQAIRIEVNDELRHLRSALADATEALRVGGRIAVISYHSLEDRIVKQTFRAYVRRCTCPPDLPVCVCGRTPVLRLLKDRSPSPGEIRRNPRARSARLRIAEKLHEVDEEP
jgi:16S rRNA (cytosine1402-N4)-methyltransferase